MIKDPPDPHVKSGDIALEEDLRLMLLADASISAFPRYDDRLAMESSIPAYRAPGNQSIDYS
jgi:hypothetical protein